jgi:lysophosphatidate acyltransferase
MLEALHEISIVPPRQPEEEKFEEKTLPDSGQPTPNPTEEVEAPPPNPEQGLSVRIPGPTSGSSASISSSFASSAGLSERDAETEEDEGMILVGRPT